MPILHDGELRLRPLALPQDVDLALPWYRDPEVLWMSEGTRDPYSRETVAEMFSFLSAKGESYIIEVQSAGAWHPVGDAHLCNDCLPIVIGEPVERGKGLGSRILLLLIDRARELEMQELLVDRVHAYNERSKRMFLKAGFEITQEASDQAPFLKFRLPLKI